MKYYMISFTFKIISIIGTFFNSIFQVQEEETELFVLNKYEKVVVLDID